MLHYHLFAGATTAEGGMLDYRGAFPNLHHAYAAFDRGWHYSAGRVTFTWGHIAVADESGLRVLQKAKWETPGRVGWIAADDTERSKLPTGD